MMRIALVQIASPDEESAAHRLDRVRTMLAEQVPTDVDLIVLPELWKVGFNHFDQYAACAESLHGPTIQVLSKVAADRRCLLHAGSIVRRNEAQLLNTSVLLDRDGRIIHHYDKVHLFGYQSAETELLTSGRQLHATGTEFGNMAAATCYDLRFPPLWAALGEAGAELVIVPAAWPARRREHWQLLTGARAVDNQIFVIACNAVGTHGGVALGGHSRVVDPWGEVVGEADDAEGVTVVEIDPGVVHATRTEFPVLSDRLPDYSVINIRKATA
jgi:predicted amidohydrolase